MPALLPSDLAGGAAELPFGLRRDGHQADNGLARFSDDDFFARVYLLDEAREVGLAWWMLTSILE